MMLPKTARLTAFLIPVLALAGLTSNCSAQKEEKEEPTMAIHANPIHVTSEAFQEGGTIPRAHTCDGADESPPLAWAGVPEECKSLALIADDPDAPMGTWVHWVLYNLPADTRNLPEGVSMKRTLENGASQGKTDFGRIGYGGPCPPSGKPHRYDFKVYALDVKLNLSPGATKEQLLRAMEGHILAQGQLMGKYGR